MNLNKLKKVAMVSAIAVVASGQASAAVIDIDVATDQKLAYADEAKGALTDGKVAVVKEGVNTSVTGSVDIAAAKASVRYMRFDLTNGVFDGAPVLVVKTKADCSDVASVTAIEGGGTAQAFATFKVTAAEAMIATCDWTLTPGTGFKVDPAATLNMQYSVYETVGQSSQTVYSLATVKSVDMLNFVSGYTPANAIKSSNATATVASDFRSFDNTANGVADGTLTSLGKVVVADVVTAGTVTRNLAGATATKADYLTAAQDITITGDVSQATFTFQTSADCTGGTKACTANADNTACTITATAADANWFVCAQYSGLAAGLKANKGAYSLGYGTETAVTGTLGSVVYDTISVEIPYLTTYAGYNQRIFLDNRGTVDANYTTSFTTESGVTAAGGTASAGALTAGEITVMKAIDLVTFTGGSRGTGTLELEANAANLKITTQIVDLGTGVTDTILLHPSTQQ
jgi:hypothetical protein